MQVLCKLHISVIIRVEASIQLQIVQNDIL